MKTIQGLTDEPKQQTAIILSDGSRVTLYLEYRANQLGWFYDLSWNGITINGQRLVASPNIIRQFRTRLPFGITVLTAGNVEPTGQSDFVNGTIALYLLEGEDLTDVEEIVFVGT